MTTIASIDKNMLTVKADNGLHWYNVQEWGIEGKGWQATESYFDRLPASAQAVVRQPVWYLSRMSAGLAVRFRTNAPAISVRYHLLYPELAMMHMPATGVSGADLYARNARGQWQWLAVAQPAAQDVSLEIAAGLDGQMREYLLYLPLYNGVTSFEIGTAPQADFVGLKPRTHNTIAFYGTSIMQGGCASRPGMVHSAILGRWFDCPTINLGFSGSAIMEPEIAELLTELDPRVYVFDTLPNMDAAALRERAHAFITTVRQARPHTPIVLVEDRTYANAPFIAAQYEHNCTSRQAFREIFGELLQEGVPHLHYVTGDHLHGDDYEATVDGSHATDLGFLRQAQALKPVLDPLMA
jgi:hypothetical protein